MVDIVTRPDRYDATNPITVQREPQPVDGDAMRLAGVVVTIDGENGRHPRDAWQGLEAGFARAGMRLHESAARFRRGQLLAGDEGALFRRSAEEALSARGVANPEAFCRLLVPSAFGVR